MCIDLHGHWLQQDPTTLLLQKLADMDPEFKFQANAKPLCQQYVRSVCYSHNAWTLLHLVFWGFEELHALPLR